MNRKFVILYRVSKKSLLIKDLLYIDFLLTWYQKKKKKGHYLPKEKLKHLLRKMLCDLWYQNNLTFIKYFLPPLRP